MITFIMCCLHAQLVASTFQEIYETQLTFVSQLEKNCYILEVCW